MGGELSHHGPDGVRDSFDGCAVTAPRSTDYGLLLLFAVVTLESFGVPLPGETALIAAGVLAQRGHFSHR